MPKQIEPAELARAEASSIVLRESATNRLLTEAIGSAYGAGFKHAEDESDAVISDGEHKVYSQLRINESAASSFHALAPIFDGHRPYSRTEVNLQINDSHGKLIERDYLRMDTPIMSNRSVMHFERRKPNGQVLTVMDGLRMRRADKSEKTIWDGRDARFGPFVRSEEIKTAEQGGQLKQNIHVVLRDSKEFIKGIIDQTVVFDGDNNIDTITTKGRRSKYQDTKYGSP